MRLWTLVAALLLPLSLPATIRAQGPAPLAPVPTRDRSATAAPTPAPPAGVAALTRADLETWLDGYMPYAIGRADIAGAVVVVVKDGQVLLQKGYGFADVARRKPVDPDATLFRPGSVSKLLTWTAVMQLVEQGRLDLDRDVNAYLDFRIPPRDGKPITLRNIMTHTAGFEESARYTITPRPMTLGKLLKDTVPVRIFPPGVTPAYSNYATALAGYIVERASGMAFDDYIDRRVLGPIGMTRSTFRQPLPRALAPLMSNGYELASAKAKPFEFVGPAPAGSLSATGADMAKFMIAHLAQGRGLLRPETARMMHTTKLPILPPLNRMALGFYEEENGVRNVIGHGGDTQYFHSNLSLFLDQNVGVFVSVNSAGKDGASGPLRTALMQQFTDRYFPAPLPGRAIDAATAKQHAAMMAGNYGNSRGFKTNFLSILSLFMPISVGVDADGGLLVPMAAGLAGQPRKWIEIAPFVWRDVATGERIAAKVENGRVVRWSFDTISPFMMLDRVPGHLDPAWLFPTFLAGLGIVVITALAWPAGAISRWRYAAALPFEGRRRSIFRWTRILAWLAVLTLAGWAMFLLLGLSNYEYLGGKFDWLLYLLQVLSAVVFVGLVAFAGWSLAKIWREKSGWFAKLWSVLLLLGALVLLYVAFAFHLIGFGTLY